MCSVKEIMKTNFLKRRRYQVWGSSWCGEPAGESRHPTDESKSFFFLTISRCDDDEDDGGTKLMQIKI